MADRRPSQTVPVGLRRESSVANGSLFRFEEGFYSTQDLPGLCPELESNMEQLTVQKSKNQTTQTELSAPPPIHQSSEEKSLRSFRTALPPPSLSSESSMTDLKAHQEPEFPEKKGCRVYRFLRWNVGSMYKRIFTVAFLGNVATIIVLLVQNLIDGSGLTYGEAGTAVACNILMAMIVRNEHIVNGVITVFGVWPRRLPLRLRHFFAKVYCYGGIHSGCGVAATFWYMVFLGLITRDYVNSDMTVIRSHILEVSYAILFLLVSILVFAYPTIRIATHNWFEGIHRFMGWSATLLFWVQTFLVAADTAQTANIPYWKALLQTPAFSILICITSLVIYPWARLRLRDVEVQPLSSHCVKLNFTYTTGWYGQAVRLADSPLKETHAFALIPNTTTETEMKRGKPQNLTYVDKKGFSVIISNAGDWTRRMINNPPRQIYSRGVPQDGVLRIALMFRPCLIVATGSGISPCLSLFIDQPTHPVRVVWATKDPLKTFGKPVLDTIYGADPNAVVIDSRKDGRPDVVKLVYQVWKNSGSEPECGFETAATAAGYEYQRSKTAGLGRCQAVIIISNQTVTRKVVYGLESRGVPAYGAIFDS
ncbi:uncharacterized protein E0L32_002285 [Thyridium curvatum]|uniref:Uncharacterized protein n=1 Tax=Thyridium curvatum TaxID=1093900 RepID=A0A507APM7_9PEZI|nr:uncharacterized protein E0L32_002285 [Thyridium curvatum]TPX06789.1 hypothetical protein E0L32_002285 [Thyridium curvatum]